MQETNKIPVSDYKLYIQSAQSLPSDISPQQLSTAIQNFLSKEQPEYVTKKSQSKVQYIINPCPVQLPTFSVYVRSQRKDCIAVQFYTTDTMGIVKQRIAFYLGMEIDNIILISKGRRIDEEESTLLQNVMKDKQFLYVVDTESLDYKKGKIIVEKTFQSLAKTVTVSSDDTLSQLYSKVEHQTQVNRNCFNLFYLGIFLDPESKLSLKQAFVADGCEMKATVNQKKLLMVQSLAQVFIAMTILAEEIVYFEGMEEILENQTLALDIIDYLKISAQKVAATKPLIEERYALADAFDREISEIYRKYYTLIVDETKEMTLQHLETSKLFALSGALTILKNERELHIEVFLLDCVLFNRQRKSYFFENLDRILKNQTHPDEKVDEIIQLIDWLSNKANFARIDRLSGYQISVLSVKIRTLIQTLYESSDHHTVTEYIHELQTNCYTLDGMPDILSFKKGYILINLKLLEEINNQYDVFAQISVLYYLLALHYPLFNCPPEQQENLQLGIRQNMSNMQNQEFVSSITQLLFKDDMDFV